MNILVKSHTVKAKGCQPAFIRMAKIGEIRGETEYAVHTVVIREDGTESPIWGHYTTDFDLAHSVFIDKLKRL